MEQLPIIGLSLDTEPQDQPENTYRFALNILSDSSDGSQGSQTFEYSNSLHASLVGDVVGVITMTENQHCVFTDAGYIYLVGSSGATVITQRSDFNFNTAYPITGQFVIQKGCERILYWRDSNNPDRYYNIDKPDRFNDLNDFNINPDVNYPYSAHTVLPVGGIMEYGAYSFVYEVLDNSFNVILKSPPSEITYITPHNNITGTDAEAGGKPNSSNSIRLDISGLDTRFNYLRIGVLYSTTSNGAVTLAHYIGEIIPINQSTYSYTYRGFNQSAGDYLVDYTVLLERKVNYDTSRTMEQVQGRLLRANLVEQKRDYASYQKYASKICTKYVISENETYSELGDEVIAKGIVYIHADGSLSPPMHIPGRSKLPHDGQEITSDFYLSAYQEGSETTQLNATITATATLSGTETTIQCTYSFDKPIASGTLYVKANQYYNPDDINYEQSVTLATAGTFTITFDTGVFENKPDFQWYIITESGELYNTTITLNLDYNGVVTLETNLSNASTTIEAWKLNNTAVKDATPETGYVSSGLMGYYECTTTYENPPEFCGNDFWGVDCNGVPLLHSNIRHHRMPCRYIEPLISDNNRKRYIGVKFSNITYPPDVIGHFFVTSVRTPSNSTVVSAAVMLPYNYTENVYGDYREGRYTHYIPNSFDNDIPTTSINQNLISHQFLVDKLIVRGEFIKVNGYFKSTYEDNRPEYEKLFANDLSYDDLFLYGKHHAILGYTPQSDFIRMEDSYFLPYASRTLQYRNYSLSSDFNVAKLERAPVVFATNRCNWNYVYVKNSIAVHYNLPAIQYRLMGSKPLTGASNVLFNGDVFISKMSLTNISRLTVGDSSNIFENVFSEGPAKVEYEYIKDVFMESTYNMDYRTEGTVCNTYYKDDDTINDFIINRTCEIIKPDNKRQYKLRDSVCVEWYGYNKDFSVRNTYTKYNPLLYSYDYCSKCLNKYPNRIIWSQVQSEEQMSDSYRVYKPLDYTDLPANRGPITSMNYKENNLLIRTTESAFVKQPNPQTLNASGVTVTLGTGDFLSVPPIEILSNTLGYCGQQHVYDHVDTPHGLVWINQRSGKVFNYAGGVEEISRFKMYHWFNNNLPSNIEQYLSDNGFTYDKDTFSCKLGYDPKTERLILHKKDYQPRFRKTIHTRYSNGYLYEGLNKLDYNDPEQFVNKSFTISYSFRKKMWESFHSYQPDFIFGNNTHYYTTVQDGVWVHNNYSKFGNYYGMSFPKVIEYVDKRKPTYNLHAIYYYTTAQSKSGNQWVDNDNVSFDKCLVYTRHQSTGEFELNYISQDNELDGINWSNTVKPLQEYNKQYKIAQIRDIAVASPVISNDWDLISPYYTNGQGYMDIVPINVDENMDQSDLREFNDTYALIRFSSNKDDYKLTMHIFDSMQFNSVS